MKLLEFNKQFGMEEECVRYLKDQRKKASYVQNAEAKNAPGTNIIAVGSVANVIMLPH